MASTGSMTSGAQPRGWVDAQRRKAQAASLAPNPTLRDVLYAALLIVLTDLGATLGMILGGLAFGATGATTTGVVASLVTAAVTFWFLFLRRWSWYDLGFRRGRHSLWHLSWQMPALIITTSLLFATVGLALNVITLRPSAGPLSPVGADAALALLLVLVPSVVSALIQEILFRRIVLDWLLQHLPIPAAATITVAVFAAAHPDAASILHSLILGVALTASRLWYGNLWAPVIMSCVVSTTVLGAALFGIS